VTSALATGALQMADNGTDSYIVAIGHGLPIKMVAPQCAINPYTLVVGPSIKSWADLKGKPVILGTKEDVTAIVFTGMAAEHKLKMDDFSIIVGGASSARYAALSSGNVAGAVLSQPFDLLAESKGMRVLATAHDAYKEWALACTAVNVGWAANNRATAVKVLRAERKAIQFGYANRAASVQALIDSTRIDATIANAAYDLLFGRWKAFDPNLRVSSRMLQTVGKAQIDLGIMTTMPSIGDLYDGSFVADALR
jgi:ABC-type nitrate/sulfonate/bicarbonate transport system substrate-binding protein